MRGLAWTSISIQLGQWSKQVDLAKLLYILRATPALLRFLGSVDLFGDTARTAKEAELGDQWGWEALREWEDEGVG